MKSFSNFYKAILPGFFITSYFNIASCSSTGRSDKEDVDDTGRPDLPNESTETGFDSERETETDSQLEFHDTTRSIASTLFQD